MKAADLSRDRMLTSVLKHRQFLSTKEVGRELLWNRHRRFVQLRVRERRRGPQEVERRGEELAGNADDCVEAVSSRRSEGGHRSGEPDGVDSCRAGRLGS